MLWGRVHLQAGERGLGYANRPHAAIAGKIMKPALRLLDNRFESTASELVEPERILAGC
jgi:hypothetical protein